MFVVPGSSEQNRHIQSVYNKRMCYAIKFLFCPARPGANAGLQSALSGHTGPVAPLGSGAVCGEQPECRRILAGDRIPPGTCLLSSEFRRSLHRGTAQQPVRPDPGLGAGALHLPRAPPGGCADRPALRHANRRLRHRLVRHLCPQRLDRPVGRPARPRACLQPHRGRHCPDLHRAALRGAHPAAGAAGGRDRAGGGGRESGCQPLADVRQGAVADPDPGAPHRLCPGICPRGGGVRLSHLHRRQPAHGVGNRTADDHEPPGGV